MFDAICIETAGNQVTYFCKASARAWISQEGVRKGCPSISVTAYGRIFCKSIRGSALQGLMIHIINASAIHCLMYVSLSPECPCVG